MDFGFSGSRFDGQVEFLNCGSDEKRAAK